MESAWWPLSSQTAGLIHQSSHVQNLKVKSCSTGLVCYGCISIYINAGACMTHELVSIAEQWQNGKCLHFVTCAQINNFKANVWFMLIIFKTYSINWLTRAAFWKFTHVVFTFTENIWKFASLNIFKLPTSSREWLQRRLTSTSKLNFSRLVMRSNKLHSGHQNTGCHDKWRIPHSKPNKAPRPHH